MKRFFDTLLLLALLLGGQACVYAQDNICDVEFVRHSFVRNHYNLRLPYAQINMQGTHLFEANANDVVLHQWGGAPLQCTQRANRLQVSASQGGGAVVMRCSMFHPFLCYEVGLDTIAGEQGMAFYSDKQRIVVYKRPGAIGVRTDRETREVPDAHDGPMILRTQWTGARLHVFACTESGDSLALSLSAGPAHWDERSLDDWSWGAYAKLDANERVSINKVEATLACGTGQADPAIVQHADGSPYIVDGKLYVMLTTRGFEQIPDSYQGIYRLDLTTFQWELMGALHFTRQGDHLLHPYHATRVVRDDAHDRWLVMTVSHGEDHCLMQGETRADILHGMHVMDVAPLHEPYEATHTNEDPDFLWDAKQKQWILAYVSVMGDKGYQTILARSKQWNGPYKEVAHSEVGNETGTKLVSLPNTPQRYAVLSGGTDYNVLRYPTLEREGGLRVRYPDGGFRGWASIIRIPWNDSHRWLWITFDRGRPYGRYSYGTLYIYLSKLN